MNIWSPDNLFGIWYLAQYTRFLALDDIKSLFSTGLNSEEDSI